MSDASRLMHGVGVQSLGSVRARSDDMAKTRLPNLSCRDQRDLYASPHRRRPVSDMSLLSSSY